MAGLGATTQKLGGLRRHWRDLVATAKDLPRTDAGETRLQRVDGFGSNPGHLQMFTFVPADLPPSPALVIVLHGCTQDAAGYDAGAGWSTLAERYGFVLVCPQQEASNNPKTCFNWFMPGDTTRGEGEALSIRQMVARAVQDHGVDPRRIFVTGLSAGGAMAAAMLATYPEVFAGGAIVAGLPYGAARNVQQALQAMFEAPSRPARDWGDLVRAASPHRGPWPRISIWHGGADAVVKPVNAGELAKQWSDVHGLAAAPSRRETVDGHAREVWVDGSGREVMESFAIGGMGHGTPLEVGEGDGMCGSAGPFLLDVGISSSFHIARFWGLTGSVRQARPRKAAPRVAELVAHVGPNGVVEMGAPPRPTPQTKPAPSTAADEVGTIIANALRAAGLMKP